MIATFLIVAPIFGLIFLGWLVRKIGLFGPAATTELNRFVVYLALPALLFDIIAHVHWSEIWQPGFILVFTLSSLIVFAAAMIIQRRTFAADAAIDALNAAYGNTGYMGFPLALLAFGQEAMAPATTATVITVCITFALAIIVVEAALHAKTKRSAIIFKVALSLSKNPLLAAPFAAALIPLTGLTLPVPVETFLKLLGGTASPCALVALGLFLGEKQAASVDTRSVVLLVCLKLIVKPLIAWGLATFVFRLPSLLTHMAVLMAALPTGTGPFMLAEFYGREAQVTSRVILVSTILSVVTLPAYLAVAR